MPTTCPPPTIYTQAPQLVRRSPSLMLSPGSSQASGIGSSVRCSVSSSQHPACSSASATSYLTPSTKNVQSNINDNFPTSPIGSATIIPYSYYGGSKTVTSTTMTSSLIHRKKPLLTRSEVSHPAHRVSPRRTILAALNRLYNEYNKQLISKLEYVEN